MRLLRSTLVLGLVLAAASAGPAQAQTPAQAPTQRAQPPAAARHELLGRTLKMEGGLDQLVGWNPLFFWFINPFRPGSIGAIITKGERHTITVLMPANRDADGGSSIFRMMSAVDIVPPPAKDQDYRTNCVVLQGRQMNPGAMGQIVGIVPVDQEGGDFRPPLRAWSIDRTTGLTRQVNPAAVGCPGEQQEIPAKFEGDVPQRTMFRSNE